MKMTRFGSKTLDKDFMGVVEYVAPLVNDIELDNYAERKLTRKLEKKQIDLRKEYVTDLEKVNKLVQSVDEIVQNMNKTFVNLTDRIEHVKETNTNLLQETRRLQVLKKKVEAKKKAVESFLDKFSLSDAEIDALDCDQKDNRLSPQFFLALQHAKEIHNDSKELITTTGNHLAAIEVMDAMEKRMKAAYTTIFSKITREFRLLNSDFIVAKCVIVRSLCCLQDFPYMLQLTLDEYATIRGNEVLRQYIEALTKGPHGSGKPIELMSHDKMRYVGDMLAFMLEVTGNEMDLLEQLLSECDKKVLASNSAQVLNNSTKSFCAPFKVRVEQSLSTESECVLLFRISNLFSFYAQKFRPVIGEGSELEKTLVDLHSLSMTMFYAGLNTSVQKILSKMSAPDYDLLPVQAVHHCLMLLKEVLDTHDGGMGSRPDAKEDFQKIFEFVLDPLTREVQLTATQLHSPLDVAVYTLNCLSAIQSVVVLYQFADKRLEMIDAMIESNADVLVSEEVAEVLKQTRILNIYQKASAHQKEQGPLSAVPGMDKATVAEVLINFSVYLHNPSTCHLDHASKISSSRIRESVRRRSVTELINVYSCLAAKFSEPNNGYLGDEKFNFSSCGTSHSAS
ncbi:unnamed protein product [Caenorhabditis auriculariae]|uniref:Conserved oligomeric Golgi complex subunit 6 n=1 Tax=Caenorhabditis auriculariae TaxID=2777116 RepID=A0A8S1GR76_9PELO|nr:unnamed protein product [Caenorhabditis auriculariae]